MKQMVILAIRTLFVNSDYNHSHQPDFSYVLAKFVTPRKTCWRQTWCKWSGEVLRQQAGVGHVWALPAPRESARVRGDRDAGGDDKRVSWLSQPDLECWEQDSWLSSSQFFNKSNDPKSQVCSLNWSISEYIRNNSDPGAAPRWRENGMFVPNSGRTPGLTKVAKRIFSF